jgi:hypothetical protein
VLRGLPGGFEAGISLGGEQLFMTHSQLSLHILLQRRFAGLAAAALVAACLYTAGMARAENGKPAGAAGPAPVAAAPSAGDVPQLVRQLDSDQFAKRDYSAQRLFQIGRAAIGPLADAAHGHSLEQTAAAVDLLARFLQSGDSESKKAAKTALEQLAQGDCDAAASRAADALRPPAEATPPIYGSPLMQIRRNVNAIRIQQLQLRAARVAAARAAMPAIRIAPAQTANPPANPPATVKPAK